jgi:hypothetical protein
LLMCKFKWADRAIEEFTKEILPYTLKDMYGNYVQFQGYSYKTMAQHLDGGSRRDGAGLCHHNEGFRKLALREFNKILDLGSSGILYDELSNTMLLCFDQSHGHRMGDCHYKGSLMLAEEFYNAAKERNKDFVMAGEGTNDPMSQYYPINYVRTWKDAAWFSEGEHKAAWKYLNPDMKIAACLIGWDDREIVHQCIAYGYIINYEPYNFKGRISDFPTTVAYGQKAQALRKRLWDYIWLGKFTDTVGAKLEVEGGGGEYIYTVFENRSNSKKAVVVANQGHKGELHGKLTLDNGSKEFSVYNMENECVTNSDGNITIAPRSLLVLIEK